MKQPLSISGAASGFGPVRAIIQSSFLKGTKKYEAARAASKPGELIKLLIAARQHKQRLEGRQYRQRKERDEYFGQLLCLYDGIKLRSYNQEYISWLKMKDQRKFFGLQPTFCYLGETEFRLKGKYLNIDIEISYQGKWVVDFSGSVHKLFNILTGEGAHNYNDFYWAGFLQVYAVMVTVFKFNPYEMEVVNLEVGTNLLLPDWFELSITELIDSTLSLWGVCKNKSSVVKSDRDSFSVGKAEKYLKMYDKSLQHKLKDRVLRLELGYERSRQIIAQGRVKYFSCLTNLSSLATFKIHLMEAFKTLHTYHPDLKKLPVEEIEADREVLEYNEPLFWCKQKKANSYKYLQKRKKQERLTNKYCSYNLTDSILKMLSDKLK